VEDFKNAQAGPGAPTNKKQQEQSTHRGSAGPTSTTTTTTTSTPLNNFLPLARLAAMYQAEGHPEVKAGKLTDGHFFLIQ
jgi:hypothetical protein